VVQQPVKRSTEAATVITDKKFVGDGIGIAVRKEDNDLREKPDKALEEIRADGTYKTINDKYFTIDVYTMK
jgi:polar amino acid transport system substrate-binding protein